MDKVIPINKKRQFTLDEARVILPVIRRITGFAHEEVKKLTSQLALISARDRKAVIEDQVQDVFKEWYAKIRKLGCEAKGMWLVDFDSGEGYYCWHYPEADVDHFHGYSEGFRGRVKVH
jgi:hypothetical protein